MNKKDVHPIPTPKGRKNLQNKEPFAAQMGKVNLRDEKELKMKPKKERINYRFNKPHPREEMQVSKTPERLRSKPMDNIQKDIHNNAENKPKFNPLANKNKKFNSPQKKLNAKQVIRNLKPFLKNNKILMFKEDFEKTRKNIPILKRSITSVFTPFRNYFYMEDMNKVSQKEMQDFHCISDSINGDDNTCFFSIFDGHGGQFSAKYCEKNFVKIFAKEFAVNKANMTNCIENSFRIVNEQLLNDIPTANDGTTASVVVIQKQKLRSGKYIRYIYCGNVGDSRIFLVQKDGKSILLSKDHNCKDPAEVQRIKNRGGMVFNCRVFGSLALTRTIGDKEMKEYGVIADPFLSKHMISDKDNYVIIASDGIWDIVTESDLDVFSEEDLGAEALCMKIIDRAMKGGTTDNVSCITIKL